MVQPAHLSLYRSREISSLSLSLSGRDYLKAIALDSIERRVFQIKNWGKCRLSAERERGMYPISRRGLGRAHATVALKLDLRRRLLSLFLSLSLVLKGSTVVLAGDHAPTRRGRQGT